MINIKTSQELTKIYLVTNCFDDPNKVYIGKEKYPKNNKRIYRHQTTYGKNIVFTYIDEIEGWERQNWAFLECYWIEQFRQWGFEVMNKNKGGGGNDTLSEETKLKISKSKIGKKYSLEARLNMSKAALGKPKSEEMKKKVGDFNRGKIVSEETRMKIGQSRTGKKYNKNPK